jgi:ribose transport system ATP-binding protein
MVTEDRKKSGLLLSQSIRVNSSLCNLNAYTIAAGIINQTEERTDTTRMREELDLRCNDIEQSVETLSGGNQQKVVVGKWLLAGADVYLFDEPTRGIDVAAREKIHRIFTTLTAQGKGIVIVSSDLDELFETCDRIGVMSAGKLVATFSREAWSTDLIMQAAFSGYIDPSEE